MRNNPQRVAKEMPADDWFKESDIEGGQTSAPYFYWIIEGITSEN